jgi:SpoVK/Ycf46/Vps4 family AAA+-type ATPase
VLLNGAPGGGKSTIVRRLLENADTLGPPLRVLRIGVADFDYLRPSVIEAVVRLLLPDGIVIDDFDRLLNADKLLDFLEAARTTTRFILATSNDSGQLSAAVRRPKRFDVIEQVEGVGDELAARLLGERWADLDDEQRARLATWPAVFVEELAGLLEVLSGLVVGDEIAELQKRVDPPPAKPTTIEAAPAAGATT